MEWNNVFLTLQLGQENMHEVCDSHQSLTRLTQQEFVCVCVWGGGGCVG
jgi:hypothetical protein